MTQSRERPVSVVHDWPLLLIEDSESDGLLLREALRTGRPDDFRVEQAFSLREGLEALERSTPACILLDLGLPDSSGLEGLEQVLERAPAVPVVLMTAREDEALALRALQLGAQDYLVKEHASRAATVQAVRYAIERRQAERALREAELQAQQAQQALHVEHAERQKLEALGVLASGVAHDFNNLLTVILGNTGIALATLDDDARIRGPLEQVEIAATRSAELVRQMLAYTGRGRMVVETLHVAELVSELSELSRTSLPASVTVSTAVAPDTPNIGADATQLRQVILNLVTNGAEAIGEAPGEVELRADGVDVDRADLSGYHLAEYLRPGRFARLQVIDSGEGMDAGTQAKMFEPFFSTRFTGRGLGLAAVHGIVRAHAGAIHVATQPGEGTTVTVLIPAAAAPVDQAPVADAAPAERRGLVLVADDEEIVRRIVARMLDTLGFDAVTAEDGAEALRIIRERGNDLTFVLLDQVMPELVGEEVVLELGRFGPQTPIVICSAFSTDDLRVRLAGRGIVAYLQKPYVRAELEALAEEIVRANPRPAP